MLCDGDGQFDPADLERLTPFVPEYDVVCGRRAHRADPLMRRINGKAWTTLVRVLLGITITDIDCGFKLFKREKIDGMELRAHGAMISTELMARVAGRKAKVKEVDVQHLPRMTGEQSGANLKVVARAFKELIALYRELRAEREGRAPGGFGAAVKGDDAYAKRIDDSPIGSSQGTIATENDAILRGVLAVTPMAQV